MQAFGTLPLVTSLTIFFGKKYLVSIFYISFATSINTSFLCWEGESHGVGKIALFGRMEELKQENRPWSVYDEQLKANNIATGTG